MIAFLLRRNGHSVIEAATAGEAFDLLDIGAPDLVLLDVRLPDCCGLDVLRAIRGEAATRLTPVVMMTGHAGRDEKLAALACGVTDFLIKPFDPDELVARTESLLRSKRYTDALEEATQVVVALAKSLDARDHYTAGHSERVSLFASLLGERVGLGENELQMLRLGSLLHDLGKIAVSDRVLLKPGRLNDAETVEVRRHPTVGHDLISHLKSLAAALPLVLHHHERLDGSGYPYGLAGDQIPLIARITSVADIYDAMTTPRPYRRALTVEEALEVMRDEARRGWWDRELVDLWSEVVRDSPERAIG